MEIHPNNSKSKDSESEKPLEETIKLSNKSSQKCKKIRQKLSTNIDLDTYQCPSNQNKLQKISQSQSRRKIVTARDSLL